MKTEANDGLFCEIYWGTHLSGAWSYGPEQPRVLAAPDETVPLPLYGFTLPEEPFLLAERTPHGYRIFLPPKARLERSRRNDAFHPVPASELQQHEGRTCVELTAHDTLRLIEGQLALYLQPSVAGKRVASFQLRDYGWLAVVMALFLSLPVGFLIAGPDPARMAETNARILSQAREREAAERRQLGVDTPPRPLAKDEQRDAGMKPLPANLSIH